MHKISQPKHDFLIEKDIDIPLRDGARLKADVFRPKAAGRFPALINIGAYQKDKVWVPPPDLEESANPYMNWETVNPLWWVPRGYAAVRVDTRGSGKSPGQTDLFSLQEALDFYDAIWLEANEKVELNVEIWPTCMVFRKGHRLRLDIQPRDGLGLEGITQVVDVPGCFVVHPSIPAKSVKEMVAYLKANPGKLNFGSPAPSSANRLEMEMFTMATKR